MLIVGGRATGTAMLVHLSRLAAPGSVITVVDPADAAYPSVFDDPHPLLLANTSAAINTLCPERPDDFAAFAGCGLEATVPRSVVGKYREDRARSAIVLAAERGVSVHRVTASCMSVRAMPGRGYEARLSDGQRVSASDVVLAVGVGPVRRPAGTGGIAPFPSVVLMRRAPRHALVLGQGQSAIDAALMLCHAGAHVVMASRTGRFPAVRTRTLPRPLRIGAAELRRPARVSALVNSDCLAQGLAPLAEQLCQDPDPVGRLREEVALAAADACPWQDSIVGILDLMTASGRRVEDDEEFIWRYVTSVALPTAQRLLSRIDAGQITIAAIGSVDASAFDAVVVATGFSPPALHHTDNELFFTRPPGGARALEHVDSRWRVGLSARGRPERIWALGPASWPRAQFANFLRTAVNQAVQVAHRITRG